MKLKDFIQNLLEITIIYFHILVNSLTKKLNEKNSQLFFVSEF